MGEKFKVETFFHFLSSFLLFHGIVTVYCCTCTLLLSRDILFFSLCYTKISATYMCVCAYVYMFLYTYIYENFIYCALQSESHGKQIKNMFRKLTSHIHWISVKKLVLIILCVSWKFYYYFYPPKTYLCYLV